MSRLDYRNTEYCKILKKIGRKKIKLIKNLTKEHPRTRNFYTSISRYYKKEFYEIYNKKCAYCGASFITLGIDRLEIDHFIHESSFDTDKIEAGKIENLVLACCACNRRKSNYLIKEKKRFHPDMKNIKKLFYRNTDYSIKILDKYKDNEEVKNFFSALGLDSHFRKLDFFILKLSYMLEENPEAPQLCKLYLKLLKERNEINSLKKL
ncbi:MAG: HNH endonuclease [Fusobacteriaceae bacterium]